MKLVSLLIPTLNEADNIDPLVDRLFAVDWPESVKIELVFVDDSSTDETRAKIARWQKCHPIRLVSREAKDGLASAVVAGAQHVRGEFVVVMDADLSHPPEKIPAMIAPLLKDQAEMVIGSRYVSGGATPEWPLSRKIASRLASIPAYLFTDAKDPMAGFFATRTPYLRSLRPDIPGFKVGLELLAQAGAGFRVQEIPIIFHDRFEGFSKMNNKVIFDYFKQLLELAGIQPELVRFTRFVTLMVFGVLINTLTAIVLNADQKFAAVSIFGGGVLSGTILYYSMYRLWRGSKSEAALAPSQMAAAVVTLIASLGVQASGYHLFAQVMELPTTVALVLAALIGTGWLIGNAAIHVFSDLHNKDQQLRNRLFCVSIILFSLLLRLANLGSIELLSTEAYLWAFSQNVSIVAAELPPLSALLVFVSDYLLGTAEFSVRLPAFLLWLVGALFLYRLCRLFYRRTTALIALMLFASLPGCFGAGFFMTHGTFLVHGWIIASFFICRALVTRSWRNWLYCGLVSGLTLAADLAFGFFLCSSLVWLLLSGTFYRVLRSGGFYLFLLLLGSVSLLLTYFQPSWATMYLPDFNQAGPESLTRILELGGYLLVTITPVGLLSLAYGLFRQTVKKQSPRQLRADAGYRLPPTILLSHFGFSLVFMVLVSATHSAEFAWCAAITISLLPFLAMIWDLEAGRLANLMVCSWKALVMIMFFGYLIGFYYFSYGLVNIELSSGPVQRSSQNLAEQVDNEVL